MPGSKRQEKISLGTGSKTEANQSRVREMTVGTMKALGMPSTSATASNSIVVGGPLECDGGLLLPNSSSIVTGTGAFTLTNGEAGKYLGGFNVGGGDVTVTLDKELSSGAQFTIVMRGVGSDDIIVDIGNINGVDPDTPRTAFGVLNQAGTVTGVSSGTTITIVGANATVGDTLRITKILNSRVHIEGTAVAAGTFVVA